MLWKGQCEDTRVCASLCCGCLLRSDEVVPLRSLRVAGVDFSEDSKCAPDSPGRHRVGEMKGRFEGKPLT